MADDAPPSADDPVGGLMGSPDVAPPPPPPNEEDRATRARGGSDNFFAQHVTGQEPTYEGQGNLARARDVASAAFFHTVLGSIEANNEAHPPTTPQEMYGEDPRSKPDPDEIRYFQQQQLIQAYQDYNRSRLNERPAVITPAQMAQMRSDLYPDASSAGAVGADVLGTLAGGAASPETLLAPEVKGAEALGLGAGAVARMVDAGLGAGAVNAAVDPITQAADTSAGLQQQFDPVQAVAAPAVGFAGGALIHGATEVAGRFIGRVAEGFRSQRAAQAVSDLATESPAFKPIEEDRATRAEPVAPPQPAVETSAQVEQAGTSPAPGEGAPSPAEKDQPPAARAAKVKPDRAPQSLTQFLAQSGGLKPTGDLGALYDRNPFIPGYGKLLRKDGMSLDQALTAAKEAGYIYDPAEHGSGPLTVGPDELLNRLQMEEGGQKQYPNGYQPPHVVDDGEEDHFVYGQLSAEMQRAGVDPSTLDDESVRDAIAMVRAGTEADPLAAYEQAVMRRSAQFDEVNDGRIEDTGEIPGWDVPDEAARASGYRDAVTGARPERAGAGDPGGEDGGAARRAGAGDRGPDQAGRAGADAAGSGGRRDVAQKERLQALVDDLSKRFEVGRRVEIGADDLPDYRNSAQHLPDRSVIRIDPSLPHDQQVAILTHEFGHVIENSVFHNAPEAEKQAIQAAFEKHVGAGKPIPGRQSRQAMRKYMRDQHGEVLSGAYSTLIDDVVRKQVATSEDGGTEFHYLAQHAEYTRQFKEWFANQTSKFLTTDTHATGLVDRFFKGIADKWQRLYDGFTGRKGAVSEVDDFLRRKGKFFEGGGPGEARGAALQDRIRDAYFDASGGRENTRVTLAQIRERLPDVPKADLDAALTEIHRSPNATLMRMDNPREITPEIDAARLDVAGSPLHIMYAEKAEPVRSAAPPREAMTMDEVTREMGDLQFRRRDEPKPSDGGVMFRGRNTPKDAATTLPHGPNAPEILSLQRQAFDLAEAAGVPLRQGRLASSQAAGQYSRRYGVARIRDVGDFFTVAHEMGHAIEQKIQADAQEFIARNAFEFGKLDQDPQRGHPEEGFAEFMATAITNPAAAKNANPTLYQEMRQLIGAKAPDILAAMDHASAAYQRYLAAPSDQKISAAIVDGERHGWIKESIKEIKKNGLPNVIGTWLGQAYTAIVAENYPVMRAVRDLTRAIQQQQGGGLVSLPASQDPAKLIRLFASAKNGALTQLRWGVVPYRDLQAVGHSMYDAINHAAGGPSVLGKLNHETTADLSTYMVAKRVSNLWDRYTAGDLPNPPAAFSKADAIQAMTDLIAKNPRLDEAAMMAHEFTRNMLAKQRDAGIITADLHSTLTQDPFYVPLFRDVSDKPLAGKTGGGAGSDGPGLTDTVKRLRGSSRDIIDPIQGIMMQTLLAERTIRHNDIVRGLADLGERAGFRAGGIVEPVAPKELQGTQFNLRDTIKAVASQRGADPHDTALLMQSVTNTFGDDPIMGSMFKMDIANKRGEPIMFYKEAGELKAVRFAHSDEGLALYDTLGTLPRAASDLWIRSLATATKTLRLGVVSHPTFVLANYVKDQVDTAIKMRGYFPIISGLRGIWDEMSQSEASRLYAYLGGMSAGTATTGIREAERSNVAQLARRGYLQGHLSSLEGLSEMTQITEAATRNSVFGVVYKQKLKQGLAPIDAATEAAFQATDLMDFGQHGSRTLALRALIPFINPHIQGLNKAARTMLVPLYRMAQGDILTADDKERAVNAGLALGKFAAVGGVLGTMLAAINWDREEYRDATPDQKAMNFIFPIGKHVVRIPKPYELGLGFTGGEYAYAALMRDDPRAARQYMEAAWEVLKSPDILSGNPLIKSYVEAETGSSLFTGRPIVPDSLQRLDPQFQYNEKTSGIARSISNGSNVLADAMNRLTGTQNYGPWSPMLVDNVIGNLGGYLGKEVQINSKILLDQEDGPEQRFEDAAFFKRFTLDPTKWSTTVQDYYQFAGQKTGDFARASATVQKLDDNGHKQEAADYMAGLTDEKKAYVTLQIGGDDAGKAAFKPAERDINPITRAQLALGQLGAFGHELLDNRQVNTDTGEHIAMTPAQLRDVGDAVRQLAAMEMRNSLVMTNDQGYVGRPLLNVQDQFNVIKGISSEAADEVARRYATAKVLPTNHIADVWPDARKELLAKGSAADLSDAVTDASTDGYEFGGERTKRRAKVRPQFQGSEPALQ